MNSLSPQPSRSIIWLSGPVGVGKTTLGRALAERLAAGFIDGDDHADPDRPWYGSSLRTSRAILQRGLALLDERPIVVIAYPLRCTNWIFFRRRFEERGAELLVVSLTASFASIVGAERGRLFDGDERARIEAMIAQGYGRRHFSDLVVRTDQADFSATLLRLEREIAGWTVKRAATSLDNRRCMPLVRTSSSTRTTFLPTRSSR